MSKAETAEKIIDVIAQVLRGELAGAIPQQNNIGKRRLTPRQREVLSDNTVRRHVQDILEYFQAVNRSEAIFAARQQGWSVETD